MATEKIRTRQESTDSLDSSQAVEDYSDEDSKDCGIEDFKFIKTIGRILQSSLLFVVRINKFKLKRFYDDKLQFKYFVLHHLWMCEKVVFQQVFAALYAKCCDFFCNYSF